MSFARAVASSEAAVFALPVIGGNGGFDLFFGVSPLRFGVKNDIISPFRVEGDLRHLQAKAIRRGVPRLLLSWEVFRCAAQRL